jgi:hypothetical protein
VTILASRLSTELYHSPRKWLSAINKGQRAKKIGKASMLFGILLWFWAVLFVWKQIDVLEKVIIYF